MQSWKRYAETPMHPKSRITMDVDEDSPTGSSPTGSAPTGSGRSPLQSLDDKLAIIKLHLTKTGVKKKKKNDEVTLVT